MAFLAPLLSALAPAAGALVGNLVEKWTSPEATKVIGDAPPSDVMGDLLSGNANSESALQRAQNDPDAAQTYGTLLSESEPLLMAVLESGQPRQASAGTDQREGNSQLAEGMRIEQSLPSNQPVEEPSSGLRSQASSGQQASRMFTTHRVADAAELAATGNSSRASELLRARLLQRVPSSSAPVQIRQGGAMLGNPTIQSVNGTALLNGGAVGKTVSNQSVLTPSLNPARYRSTGMSVPVTGPAAATATEKATLSEAVSSAGRSALGQLSQAGGQAAAKIVTNLGDQLAPKIGEIADRASAKIGKTLDDLIGRAMKKIIGDAPPNQVLAKSMTDVTKKVVGDAPAVGDVMTEEEFSMAETKLSDSITFNLLSQLLIAEQLLHSPVKLEGQTTLDMLASTIRNGINSDLYYAGTDMIYTNFDMLGLTREFSGYPIWDAQAGAWALADIDDYYVRRVKQMILDTDSPPLKMSPSLVQILPLLLGVEPVGNYASQMRLKTTKSDADLEVQFAGKVLPTLQSRRGYGFAYKYLKLLLYAISRSTLCGDEWNQVAPGVGYQWRNGQDLNVGGFWQWSPAQRPDLANFTIAYTSLADFMRMANGLAVAGPEWADDFMPDKWGKRCAIVFLKPEDATSGHRVFAKLLQEVQYPIFTTGKESGVYAMNANAQWERIGGAGTFIVTDSMANTTVVEGPTQSVLFVRMDMNLIPQQVPAVEVTILGPILFGQNTPNNPILGNAGQGGAALDAAIPLLMIGGDFLPMLQAEIEYTETMYGCNSARASAMRLAAETTLFWGPPTQFTFADGVAVRNLAGLATSFNPNDTSLPEEWKLGETTVQDSTKIAGRLRMLTTPLMMHPQPSREGQPENETPAMYYIQPQNPWINAMVEMGYVFPEEENPNVALYDLSRTLLAIRYEGLILTSAADFLISFLNGHPIDILNPVIWENVPGVSLPSVELYRKRTLLPVLGDLLTVGIQYPEVKLAPLARPTEPTLDDWQFIYGQIGEFGPLELAFSFTRMPWACMLTWFPAASKLMDGVLDFSGMIKDIEIARNAYLANPPQQGQQAEVTLDTTWVSRLEKADRLRLAKWSMTALPTARVVLWAQWQCQHTALTVPLWSPIVCPMMVPTRDLAMAAPGEALTNSTYTMITVPAGCVYPSELTCYAGKTLRLGIVGKRDLWYAGRQTSILVFRTSRQDSSMVAIDLFNDKFDQYFRYVPPDTIFNYF